LRNLLSAIINGAMIRVVTKREVEITLQKVGEGLITLNIDAEGELRVIETVQDVIKLWKEGADGKIVLAEDAGTTTLGPIISKLAGVVCTSGALGSHLAIVTREFEIPALMGTVIDQSVELDRRNVIIKSEGEGKGVLFLTD